MTDELVELLDRKFTLGQHFIGLVKDEHFKRFSAQGTSLDHIPHSPRCPNSNNDPGLKLAEVVSHASATNKSGTEVLMTFGQKISNV